MISREKKPPVFAASTPMSEKSVELRAQTLAAPHCAAVTPSVFWAVRATIALVP
jgi:hypothetical protein